MYVLYVKLHTYVYTCIVHTYYAQFVPCGSVLVSLLDVNECRTGQHNCSEGIECLNSEGSYSCGCTNGLRTSPGGSCNGLLLS